MATASGTPINYDALSCVPSHLKIKVLYADESIVVINKPSNLRSVPGHANPPPVTLVHASSSEGEGQNVEESVDKVLSSRSQFQSNLPSSPPYEEKVTAKKMRLDREKRFESSQQSSSVPTLSSSSEAPANKAAAGSTTATVGNGDNDADSQHEQNGRIEGTRRRTNSTMMLSSSQPPSASETSISHRRTAQEAWEESIRTFVNNEKGMGHITTGPDSFGLSPNGHEESTEKLVNLNNHSNNNNDNDGFEIETLLRNLCSTRNLSCVPRKFKPFQRYCRRNIHRLLPHRLHDTASFSVTNMDGTLIPSNAQNNQNKTSITRKHIDVTLDEVIASAYKRIQERQIPLLNLPESTRDEESAFGQLKLLGYGDENICNYDDKGRRGRLGCSSSELTCKLYVVHRLDCETSGVMVFARNDDAASALCRSWRQRDEVSKFYLASVRYWPPFHEEDMTKGTIDLPLAPSSERLKWEVRDISEGGKPSTTLWNVYNGAGGGLVEKKELMTLQTRDACNGMTKNAFQHSPVTLVLQPLTGRTHQLRIHCASVGSGIVGDSLYGDNPSTWRPGKKEREDSGTLRLHAHKLSFPHPQTGTRVEFVSPRPW